MNRCAKKWKGVIHKVRIDLESAGRNTPDQNKLNCSIVVNSPENLIVVARRIQAERSALASGITAVMDRAGEALCARKTYGPQCEGIKKIYI